MAKAATISRAIVDIEREMIAAQRTAIIDMRERGEIDNVVLRRLLADLDMAASRPALEPRR